MRILFTRCLLKGSMFRICAKILFKRANSSGKTPKRCVLAASDSTGLPSRLTLAPYFPFALVSLESSVDAAVRAHRNFRRARAPRAALRQVGPDASAGCKRVFMAVTSSGSRRRRIARSRPLPAIANTPGQPQAIASSGGQQSLQTARIDKHGAARTASAARV